ncbi:hypothetical protein ES702_06200 [subsurface metagenome]
MKSEYFLILISIGIIGFIILYPKIKEKLCEIILS